MGQDQSSQTVELSQCFFMMSTTVDCNGRVLIIHSHGHELCDDDGSMRIKAAEWKR